MKRREAVQFAMQVILRGNPPTTDWQEVAEELSNHEVFGDLIATEDDDGTNVDFNYWRS